MYKFCVFGGTTEGREMIDLLSSGPDNVYACVTTEYGESLLEPSGNLTVSAKKLDAEEMRELFLREKFDLVLDATHPYARVATDNISAAAEETGTRYVRVLRGRSAVSGDSLYFPDIAAAAEYLSGTTGNVLLTTGSKELSGFAGMNGFAERVYARVLPLESSLESCRSAGLSPAHIIAMQGPFSEEMNVSTLRFAKAEHLVTKDSGDIGGFSAKANAAHKTGAKLIVIGRPPMEEGMTVSEAAELLRDEFGIKRIPRVFVVGIGPGNTDAMTGEVRRAIEDAECVIGARRMLEAVAVPGQMTHAAIAPDDIAGFIKSHLECRTFTVVMSGDVGFYSGTKKLLPLLADCSTDVLPGISSLSYLCARLGMDYEDVKAVSLHGRQRDIARDVRENAKVFTLVGGENGMAELCRRLTEAGLGSCKVSAGERLSYPDEKITTGTAEELSRMSFSSLSCAVITNDRPSRLVTHGLADEEFQRGGDEAGAVPMTKSEVRSVCLSKLMLCEDSVCWDIGAGTGSVAIEMALQARKGQVYAIERRGSAVELLEHNREKFSADNMTVVSGTAPEACEDLPAPTHVFIGGSSGNMKKIIDLILSKNPSARIVATAVTLESVSELTSCMKEGGFASTEVVSVQAARDRKAGPYHLMLANNPVYIFTLQAGRKDG